MGEIAIYTIYYVRELMWETKRKEVKIINVRHSQTAEMV